MAEDLFPIELYAYDTRHYVEYEESFFHIVQENRNQDLSWYCYDVIILSPTKAEFIMRKMEDFFCGGIGDITERFTVDVPVSLTMPHIEKTARFLAHMRYKQELREAENKIIDSYQAEILKDHGIS